MTANSSVDKALFTITEAACFLSLSRASIYRRLSDGTLDSVHVGRRHLVKVNSLRRAAGLDAEAV